MISPVTSHHVNCSQLLRLINFDDDQNIFYFLFIVSVNCQRFNSFEMVNGAYNGRQFIQSSFNPGVLSKTDNAFSQNHILYKGITK